MKTPRITKNQDLAFRALLGQTLTTLGFRPYIPDPCGHGCGREADQWIITDHGRYRVRDPGCNVGHLTLWVCGCFDDPERLPRSAPTVDSWNTCSGKWNFYGYTPGQAIDRFTYAMKAVNARPATPEEVALYDAADFAEYARCEAVRKEWRESHTAETP